MTSDGSPGDHRTYRITSASAYAQLVGPFVLLLALPIAIWQAITTPEVAWFLLPWCALALWTWSRAGLLTAYRIDVVGSAITFKTLVSTHSTSLDQIRSIKSRHGHYRVAWDARKVWVIAPMDDWHDFVTRVKSANPAVQLSGV